MIQNNTITNMEYIDKILVHHNNHNNDTTAQHWSCVLVQTLKTNECMNKPTDGWTQSYVDGKNKQTHKQTSKQPNS